MSFFNCIKLLFPRSKIFNLAHNGNLRKLCAALGVLGDDMRADAEKGYGDLFPETTRKLNEWENEFAAEFIDLLSVEQQRSVLSSLWKMRYGNATAEFIQELLAAFIPGIQVVENTPAGNPRNSNFAYAAVCANKATVCGNKTAVCAYRVGSSTFVPAVLKNNAISLYDIPFKKRYWETCFYVCGGVVRNSYHQIIYAKILNVNKKWRDFIEYIILSIKPVHTTALIYINWK